MTHMTPPVGKAPNAIRYFLCVGVQTDRYRIAPIGQFTTRENLTKAAGSIRGIDILLKAGGQVLVYDQSDPQWYQIDPTGELPIWRAVTPATVELCSKDIGPNCRCGSCRGHTVKHTPFWAFTATLHTNAKPSKRSNTARVR